MALNINFGNTSEYTRWEGGGSELLPFDGIFTCKVTKITEGKAKSSGNDTLTFTLIVQDEDARGRTVLRTQAVSGVRKDGKPNVLGLIAILESAWSAEGLTDEGIQAKIQELAGKQLSTTELAEWLVGKEVYCEMQAQSFSGRDGRVVWTSNARNFKIKRELDDAKGVNAHRRPLPPAATAGAAAPAAGAGTPVANGAVLTAQTAATPMQSAADVV